MTTTAKKTSELTIQTTIAPTDRIVFLDDPNGVPVTSTITYGNFFANVSVTAKFGGNVSFTSSLTANNLSVANFVISNKYTPENSELPIQQGTFWFDDNNFYVATANGVIKKAPLSAF